MTVSCRASGNTQRLAELESLLGHLLDTQRMELVELIKGFSSICGDAPSRTPLIEHIIDVGETPPIQQCFYWVSLEKRHVLDSKIQHMLDNGIGI